MVIVVLSHRYSSKWHACVRVGGNECHVTLQGEPLTCFGTIEDFDRDMPLFNVYFTPVDLTHFLRKI